MMMQYVVTTRKPSDHVVAAFWAEHDAKDYASWRNAGRRVWVVKPIEHPVDIKPTS